MTRVSVLTASRPYAATTGRGKWLSAGNGVRAEVTMSLGRARSVAPIAETWSRAWPRHDAEAIAALYADTAVYR